MRLVGWLAVEQDFGLFRTVPICLIDGVINRAHPVDRRLIGPRKFAENHIDIATVTTKDVR